MNGDAGLAGKIERVVDEVRSVEVRVTGDGTTQAKKEIENDTLGQSTERGVLVDGTARGESERGTAENGTRRDEDDEICINSGIAVARRDWNR